jgi:hypothetical protein
MCHNEALFHFHLEIILRGYLLVFQRSPSNHPITTFFYFFETESYIAQGDLEQILQPQPPECWDYICIPPSPTL